MAKFFDWHLHPRNCFCIDVGTNANANASGLHNSVVNDTPQTNKYKFLSGTFFLLQLI